MKKTVLACALILLCSVLLGGCAQITIPKDVQKQAEDIGNVLMKYANKTIDYYEPFVQAHIEMELESVAESLVPGMDVKLKLDPDYPGISIGIMEPTVAASASDASPSTSEIK